MFGLPSFPKLTLLLLALAAIWLAFRWIGRQDKQRKSEARGRMAPGQSGAVEMVQCEVCEAFVPRLKPSHCERAECPY